MDLLFFRISDANAFCSHAISIQRRGALGDIDALAYARHGVVWRCDGKCGIPADEFFSIAYQTTPIWTGGVLVSSRRMTACDAMVDSFSPFDGNG